VPDSATNGIGEPHVFTVTVGVSDGQTTQGIPGVIPEYEFYDPNNLQNPLVPQPPLNQTCSSGTDGDGVCEIEFYSDTAGDFLIDLSVTFTFLGAEITAYDTAIKSYVAGSLSWSKVDEVGDPLAGATFEACRVEDRHGNPTDTTDPDECTTVLDNDDSDQDKRDGFFILSGRKLGKWEIRETVAPSGYLGDFSRIGIVILTTEFPDGEIDKAWVNSIAGQILETGTICEEYVGGTAIELNEIIYRLKKGAINNVAPGVFFYYTTFTAPTADFTLEVVQSSSPGFTLFDVQNESNVRLFDAGCTSLSFSTPPSIPNGQVSVEITGATPGGIYVMSVKYETGAVVGFADPGTVHYSYSTVVENVAVDGNGNGLDLKKKGN
jgi:hypothetical protein